MYGEGNGNSGPGTGRGGTDLAATTKLERAFSHRLQPNSARRRNLLTDAEAIVDDLDCEIVISEMD